jgi:hypothetical protein
VFILLVGNVAVHRFKRGGWGRYFIEMLRSVCLVLSRGVNVYEEVKVLQKQLGLRRRLVFAETYCFSVMAVMMLSQNQR